MRGPGPKWHAKHTASLVAAAGAQRLTSSDMAPATMPSRQPVAAWLAPTAAAALIGFVAVMVLA